MLPLRSVRLRHIAFFALSLFMGESVDDRLLAKLAEVEDRFDALNTQLADPAIAANVGRLIAINKELGRLRRLTEPYRALRKVKADLDEARAMIRDTTVDP